jgi:hypothetical protein
MMRDRSFGNSERQGKNHSCCYSDVSATTVSLNFFIFQNRTALRYKSTNTQILVYENQDGGDCRRIRILRIKFLSKNQKQECPSFAFKIFLSYLLRFFFKGFTALFYFYFIFCSYVTPLEPRWSPFCIFSSLSPHRLHHVTIEVHSKRQPTCNMALLDPWILRHQ